MEIISPATQDVESKMKKETALSDAIYGALAVVDDPQREGLMATPRRWADMFLEATSGHAFNMTVFDNLMGYDEMIVEMGIPFYSMCEHHLLPFFGMATIGYIPNKKIVGISKLCRTVEHFSKMLQVQERMTQQITNLLEVKLRPKGTAVLLRARHLCQEMRGIRKPGAETVTSYLKGVFLKDQRARQEFMSIAREGGR